MNNVGQRMVINGICRPCGAWSFVGARATKMPLLTELGSGIERIAMIRYGINGIQVIFCRQR